MVFSCWNRAFSISYNEYKHSGSFLFFSFFLLLLSLNGLLFAPNIGNREWKKKKKLLAQNESNGLTKTSSEMEKEKKRRISQDKKRRPNKILFADASEYSIAFPQRRQNNKKNFDEVV